MANSDKNILITPNRNLSGQPEIAFTGLGNDQIKIKVPDDTTATLNFESSTNKLLSVNSRVSSGSIFNISDSTNTPILESTNLSMRLGAKRGKTTIFGEGLKLPAFEKTSLPKRAKEGTICYDETSNGARFFNGTRWCLIGGKKSGLSAETAATSAKEILQEYPNSSDGIYWIDLPTIGPTPTYCMFNKIDGDGWMLAMKGTTGTTFNYSSTYWTTYTLLNEYSQLSRDNADAKFNVFNFYPADKFAAIFPDMNNGGQGANYGPGWSWVQSSARMTAWTRFQTSLTLSTTPRDAGDMWSGSGFSNQGGYQFYGFNYTGNGSARVRWGFGWNNETDQATNDVSGGIGMDGSYQSYSAGDRINCCAVFTGINRAARFEIWVQ